MYKFQFNQLMNGVTKQQARTIYWHGLFFVQTKWNIYHFRSFIDTFFSQKTILPRFLFFQSGDFPIETDQSWFSLPNDEITNKKPSWKWNRNWTWNCTNVSKAKYAFGFVWMFRLSCSPIDSAGNATASMPFIDKLKTKTVISKQLAITDCAIYFVCFIWHM